MSLGRPGGKMLRAYQWGVAINATCSTPNTRLEGSFTAQEASGPREPVRSVRSEVGPNDLKSDDGDVMHEIAGSPVARACDGVCGHQGLYLSCPYR